MVVLICKVTCRDPQGIEHAVEVSAQSVYEPVAQALRVFREHEWCEDLQGSAASVVVRIRQPEVEHRVRMRDFGELAGSGRQKPGRDGFEEPAARYGLEVTMCAG
jgi:hypothetical protein